MASALPVFPNFTVRDGDTSIGHKWRTYIQKLENLFVGLNIESAKRKKALLLHFAGDDVFNIHQTLDNTGEEKDYELSKAALTTYFSPKINTEFEVFEFRQMRQELNETLDSYVTRLRQKSLNCEFHNIDNEIKSQIIQGTTNNKLRRKALEENVNLPNLLLMGRTMEQAALQADRMQGKSQESQESVDKIRHKQPQKGKKRPPESQYHKKTNTKCRNCGGNYPHKFKCPAQGKTCNYCHKPNHFVSVCRKKKNQHAHVKNVDHSDSECSDNQDESAFGIYVNQIKRNLPKLQVTVGGKTTKILVDTGSSINIISEQFYENLSPKPKLTAVKSKAFAFAQEKPLQIRGKYSSTIETKNKVIPVTLHVVKKNNQSILSYDSAVELGIVPEISSVSEKPYTEEITQKYPKVFDGLGKLKGRKVKLHVDENVTPTAQQHRRIPFHIREQVEKELDRLEKLDVIEKVEGPTPWVSPIVAAPKPNAPNQIRLCVDMRKANDAIRRERHVTPTIDDIIFKLNGATVFSKLDLLNGFHQIELDEDSRNITTFATHVGLRRYKRLNFGVSAAPEIFENEIRQVLDGLEGVISIADDICTFGKDQACHDKHLEALMKRLEERNLTLNKDKCLFNQSKITFYGYVFSKDGISADPKKVETIKATEQPKNVADVRSFLGMTNYVSRFIKGYSTITEPLRKLMQKGTKWEWTESQEQAFKTLKNALTSDCVMTYFDPTKYTEIWVDASPVGLGAILMQDDKIVSYASRSLTPVESRYNQTEREALAVVWGCEHFHLYVYGAEFTVRSDNKAMESIFNNSKPIQSARLERWRLRMVTYNFKVKFVSGKTNTADYISRHPTGSGRKSNIAEEYVKFIANSATPSALSMKDIAESTKCDKTLCQVAQAIQTNKWHSDELKKNEQFDCYRKLADELTVLETEHGSIVLRGTRLCIPEKLQQRVIDLAHKGHQGQVKCKALLRETCWFPMMDKLVENAIKECIPCLANTPQTNAEPVKPSTLPTSVWTELSIDFLGPMPDGSYFMVIIDDYSRFPVVENLQNISAKSVIPRLENIFATFGIPLTVKSDNGAPFNGNDFAEFATEYGFTHRRITPLHPMANGSAEKFMQPLQKAIKTAHTEGLNYKREIVKFLQNYRATPHPATLLSPAEIMFSRKPKTTLPALKPQIDDRYVRERDVQYKAKFKRYADQKRHAKPANFKPGDKVLVKQKKNNKLTPSFCPTPGTVVKTKGSMIRAKIGDKTVTRDASQFKPVAPTAIGKTRPLCTTQQQRMEPYRVPPRARKRPKRYADYV